MQIILRRLEKEYEKYTTTFSAVKLISSVLKDELEYNKKQHKKYQNNKLKNITKLQAIHAFSLQGNNQRLHRNINEMRSLSQSLEEHEDIEKRLKLQNKLHEFNKKYAELVPYANQKLYEMYYQ